MNSGAGGECENRLHEIDSDISKPSRGGGSEEKASIFPRLSRVSYNVLLEISKLSFSSLLHSVGAFLDTEGKNSSFFHLRSSVLMFTVHMNGSFTLLTRAHEAKHIWNTVWHHYSTVLLHR